MLKLKAGKQVNRLVKACKPKKGMRKSGTSLQSMLHKRLPPVVLGSKSNGAKLKWFHNVIDCNKTKHTQTLTMKVKHMQD